MELRVGDPIRIIWISPETLSEHIIEGRVMNANVVNVEIFDGKQQKEVFNPIRIDENGIPRETPELTNLLERNKPKGILGLLENL